MKKKKCFLFFEEFFDYIEKMNDEECKQYMLALGDYHRHGAIAQFSDRFMQSAVLKSIKLISDSDNKYKEKCERMAVINEKRKAKWRESLAQQSAEAKADEKADAQTEQEEQPKTEPVEPKPEPTAEPKPVSYDTIFAIEPEESSSQPTDPEQQPTDPDSVTYVTAKTGDILVMNGKRVVKRPNGVFIIPTIEEVESYVREKGYHFVPASFLEYYENSKPHPWCMNNGKPVRAWKQCCTTFENHVYLSEGRRAMARQQSQPIGHAHDNINNKVYEPPY